jgi:hypothetical protein
LITSFNLHELKAQEHIFTKSITKTINVVNKAIIIDAEKANIIIEEIAGENLIVDIRFISKHSDKASAEKQLEYLNHVINIKNREVYIRTFILITANEELTGNIHTLYTLKIPKNKSISITNSLGDISISNIKGNFVINSKYGKLSLQNITGEATINAQIGEVIIKNSQLNCKLESKYLSSYFNSCGGNYTVLANLGSINFALNQNLSTLTIDASGTEINLSNRDCREYNLLLSAENGSVFLDDCSIANKSFIKADTRNSSTGEQEFLYINPTLIPSISVKNKFANISLQ